ncbi:MAG: tripartite tricarboxylate transporter TctB family protein [Caldilineaceae bacterium]|nr:tripartite tricarboxylate transporter TctB family protein [Caldilineaceae bacterium]
MQTIRWVALTIIAFGAFYVWGASLIRESTTYAAVGPRFIPNAIGIGIVLSGLWLFAAPGAPPAPDTPQRMSLDWVSIGLMAGLVLLYILVFRWLGYIGSTILLLWAGAQILGDRSHLLRDGVIAVMLAATIYLVFSRLLGINLPQGLIGF